MNYDYNKLCIKSVVTSAVLHNIIHLARCINDDAIDQIQYFDSKHFHRRDTQYVSINVLLQLASRFIHYTIVRNLHIILEGRFVWKKNNNMCCADPIYIYHSNPYNCIRFVNILSRIFKIVYVLVSNLASFSNN